MCLGKSNTVQVPAGKKGGACYEANPMVNCDEPVVLWGTSLTYTE